MIFRLSRRKRREHLRDFKHDRCAAIVLPRVIRVSPAKPTGNRNYREIARWSFKRPGRCFSLADRRSFTRSSRSSSASGDACGNALFFFSDFSVVPQKSYLRRQFDGYVSHIRFYGDYRRKLLFPQPVIAMGFSPPPSPPPFSLLLPAP